MHLINEQGDHCDELEVAPDYYLIWGGETQPSFITREYVFEAYKIEGKDRRLADAPRRRTDFGRSPNPGRRFSDLHSVEDAVKRAAWAVAARWWRRHRERRTSGPIDGYVA